MSIEDWSLAINNASNIWVAGMMTIQTIAVIIAAYQAYKTYEQYHEKKIRSHAIRIKKDTQKLLYIQDIIFNMSETVELKDHQIEIKSNLKGDHLLMYVKSAIKHNLYLKYKKKIEKLQMKILSELEFLGNKELKSLNHEREKLFQEITRKFQVVEGKISSIYSRTDLDPEIMRIQEKTGYKVYQLIPELIGNDSDQNVIEINIGNGVKVEQKINKPSGLKLLDKRFNDLLRSYF